MNKSYADVLESYMIAEEGLFSKLKERFKKKENNKDNKPDNSYKFNIDAEKALEDSRLNLTPYPAGKWENEDDLFDAIEKDLKIALPKVLSSKEVVTKINAFCNEYNNTPKEDLEDRFPIEDLPSKMTINWFKSQFCVDPDGDYFIICEADQMFRIYYGMEIVEIMEKYIKKKYSNYNLHVNTGDGDEGCLYPFD